MTYELAKKLKDAWFPQKIACQHHAAENCRCYYSPTLSELIEACGYNKEESRMRFILWFSGLDWRAGYFQYGDANYIDDYPENESGSTPEEAVANLWLKLKDNVRGSSFFVYEE